MNDRYPNSGVIDDKEIERLEHIRRYGCMYQSNKVHDVGDANEEEDVYYQPKDTEMLRRWTIWRTQVNQQMADLIKTQNHASHSRWSVNALTGPRRAPRFVSESAEHLYKLRRDFSGRSSNTADWRNKFINGDSYLVFGIPRCSVRKSSLTSVGETRQKSCFTDDSTDG